VKKAVPHFLTLNSELSNSFSSIVPLKEMHQLIGSFKGKRIAVWGDFILDEYIFTKAARVSREAPVLITEYENEAFRLGGAGNVAANIKALGGEPIPIGFIGLDQGGDILRDVLAKSGISDKGLIPVNKFVTPRKTRILSGDSHTRRQQVLRIDRLNRISLNEDRHSELVGSLRDILLDANFLVISDYLHCSVRGEDIETARKSLTLPPMAVDSRRHLKSFAHIRVATPNLAELQRLYPGLDLNMEKDFNQAGTELRQSLDADGLLMKRGDEGMSLLEADSPPRRIGIYGSREIVDVTGAGDTVIALIALGLASGADLLTSARVAAVGAGLSVMKAGAATIAPNELIEALTKGKLP